MNKSFILNRICGRERNGERLLYWQAPTQTIPYIYFLLTFIRQFLVLRRSSTSEPTDQETPRVDLSKFLLEIHQEGMRRWDAPLIHSDVGSLLTYWSAIMLLIMITIIIIMYFVLTWRIYITTLLLCFTFIENIYGWPCHESMVYMAA